MNKLAVFVSGSGTNLQAIIDARKSNKLNNIEITIVISNKKEAYALTRAENEGIKNFFINPTDFTNIKDFDKDLIKLINEHNIDLIVLAGYTKILTNDFINAFPNKIINIHPALLPDFGGKGLYGKKVHEAVLKAKVKESGCTVHYVTHEVDKGPIIAQRKVPVLDGDTVESLSKRVLHEEHTLLVQSINSTVELRNKNKNLGAVYNT